MSHSSVGLLSRLIRTIIFIAYCLVNHRNADGGPVWFAIGLPASLPTNSPDSLCSAGQTLPRRKVQKVLAPSG